MKNKRIAVVEVHRRVELSLEIYNFMDADTVTIRKHYSDKPQFTYDEVIKLYNDALLTWMNYQSQLIDLEEYEICEKIKRLLDLEQKDCENILRLMNQPVGELQKRREYFNELYLNVEKELV